MTGLRQRVYLAIGLILFAGATLHTAELLAAEPFAAEPAVQRTITDRSLAWPTWSQWRRLLLLEDYNTRLVLLGTALLGCAAGTVGSFTLLRKRSLMGDALSHATLPGIGIAFVATTMAGGEGKSLAILLGGATLSGLVGLAVILFIRNATRIKEDAALGIVLSVFFGAGVAVLGVAQQMERGHAAGLEAFIYGKTASMVPLDAQLIGAAGLAVAVVCLLLFKELKLLCFDETFGASRGYPVVVLDVVLMGLVVTVTIIGLQAVGLILMIALLVVPACAARFWTERMSVMAVLSAVIGGVSGLLGAGLSALAPNLPSGAMIVLVATLVFLASMFFAPARGVWARGVRRRRVEAKVQRQHLLRAIFERLDAAGHAPRRDQSTDSEPVAIDDLVSMRAWSARHLEADIGRAERQGLIRTSPDRQVRLTPAGCQQSAATVHRHRLWELFLIRYADIAPAQVDRDADAIEHVLDASMVAELESMLRQQESGRGIMESPHALDPPPHAAE